VGTRVNTVLTPLSLPRLYLLRGAYLLLVVGGALISWTQILDGSRHWELMHGVVVCMLGAMSLLALLGLRYPLQMLPLLFWELIWKSIWLLRVALPLWRAQRMDAETVSNVFNCAVAILVLIAIPWDYVITHYVRAPGDPWRRTRTPQVLH
jgi:hypothetical protein